MSESILYRAGVPAVAAGAFVTGVVLRQPELTTVGIGIGGVKFFSVLARALHYSDWLDCKSEVMDDFELALLLTDETEL